MGANQRIGRAPRRLPGMTRRSFLQRAAGTAAAAATLNIVPSTAWGANDRIGLGFVGMGKQMAGHLHVFLNRPQTQVLALCDVEAKRLAVRQGEANAFYADRTGEASYAGVDAYEDFRELVARPDIDAVVIATPDHWHALVALRAMEQGKDVYCEKPLTLTINEGKALVATARRYGRVFQTGSQQRSSREFRTACELVRNGRIGKVHTVHVNVGGPPVECLLPGEPVPEGLNWDFWLGPAPWRPYNSDIAPDMDYPGWPNFRAYRDYSGGMMTDWGAHHFDIAQWGLGMDGSGPVEITPPDGVAYPRLKYRYANGVTMYHGGGQGGSAGVEFIGEEGRVMVNRGYLETDPPELLEEPLGPEDIRLYESSSHQDNWLECIGSRGKPICHAEIGHRSVTVCHLGNIAYAIKRPLKWDPEAEAFIDDAEANRLLQRPMRAPWTI